MQYFKKVFWKITDFTLFTADITEIDENFRKGFSVTLYTIWCNLEIDVKKLGAYALEIANFAILLYPLYYMPSTVHKMLTPGK